MYVTMMRWLQHANLIADLITSLGYITAKCLIGVKRWAGWHYMEIAVSMAGA